MLDNLSTGTWSNLRQHEGNRRVERVEGDVGDRELVRSLLDGVDVVFHLACRGVRHSIGRPMENHEANATATLVLLQEAHRAKVKRFIHVSSSEVYGTAIRTPMDEEHPCFPETVYGATKLAGECYARSYYRTYGMATTVVRPFNNFGPRSHHEGDAGEVIPRFVVWALNSHPPVIFGDGLQTRDFLYVTDTAYWLRQIAHTDALIGETINLASGKETSVLELAKIVTEEAGVPELSPKHLPARPGDVRRLLGESSKAVRMLGFAPKVSVREGIREVINHFRSSSEGTERFLAQIQAVNWDETAAAA